MASTLLNWRNSGLGIKTGTTTVAMLNDMVTLFNTKLSDPNFTWQVAGSNTAAGPYYIVLKRKSGVPGRILIVVWTVSPAGNNSTILDQTPANDSLYCVWFPNGNTDTPINLTVASGVIMGDDTNCTKVSAYISGGSTNYAATMVPFYFDSVDAVWLGVQQSAGATSALLAAGEILVDTDDNAVGGVFGPGPSAGSNSFFSYQPAAPWASSKPGAGSGTACFRTNFGNSNSVYFQAWMHPSTGDILVDNAAGNIMFVPQQLIGFAYNAYSWSLKLRQVAGGPNSGQAFANVFTSGGSPILLATQFNACATGGGSYPWMTYFKL